MKKMMALAVLSILVLCIGIGCAEITNEELYAMSVEELVALQAQIDLVLQEKGHSVYVDISHGDKGENVVRLQEKLKEFGYFSGKISGKYDTVTEKAVKKFQKDNNLEVSGVATQALQELLYSMDVSNIVTATPKPTVAPTATIDPTFSEYSTVSYDECARYPDRIQGVKAKLDGKVLQVLGTKETGFEIRLSVSGDVYYIKIRKGLVDYNILEDDRLTVYGVMNGLYTYTSTLRKTITIPYAIADAVILR